MPFNVYVDPELRENFAALVLQQPNLSNIVQDAVQQALQRELSQSSISLNFNGPQSQVLAHYWDGANSFNIAEPNRVRIPSNGIIGFPWVIENDMAYRMDMNAFQSIYEHNDVHALELFLPHVLKTKFLTHMVVNNRFKHSILDYAQPSILDILAHVGVIQLK